MPLSNARLSYKDCFDIFDAALANKKGVRVELEDMDKATFLRMRLHNARKIDRKDSTEIYSDGHPMFGQSIYDKLAVRLRTEDGKVWLYVEQISLDFKIENLGEPIDEAPTETEIEEPEIEPPKTAGRRI